MTSFKPNPRAAMVLLALAAGVPGAAHASTVLTFATTGNTGVDATSGGPILAANPNASLMLASGTPLAATPNYGSNVTASSANNGAYLVVGSATPDIALNWTSNRVAPTTNVIEGIGKATAGWGSEPSNLTNNGVGQINNLVEGYSFSITFTPANGKGVLIESLDFYKSNLTLAPNQARGLIVTVSGITTNYRTEFAISAAQEGIKPLTFEKGGIAGQPGEEITLTILRPAAALETEIVQRQLGSGFTIYATSNQNGIDNLRFSEASPAIYAIDTDGDGVSDVSENFAYGSDPNRADTDGDGIPDNVEINTLFTSPLVSEAKLVNYLAGLAGKPGPLVVRDSFAKSVKLRFALKGTETLTNFTAIPFTAAGVTPNVTGAPLRIDLPANAAPKYFYRLGTTF